MMTYTTIRHHVTPDGARQPSMTFDLLAGGLAGTTSWLATVPLDVIKTRIQSDPLTVGGRYVASGIRQCVIDGWRAGGWRVFYRGLGATCLRAFPVNAVTLVVYSKSLMFLHDHASSLSIDDSAARGSTPVLSVAS